MPSSKDQIYSKTTSGALLYCTDLMSCMPSNWEISAETEIDLIMLRTLDTVLNWFSLHGVSIVLYLSICFIDWIVLIIFDWYSIIYVC